MSYEGYSQYWCKNGHYWEHDCMERDDVCNHCGEKAVFENSVDQTNGSCDENGKRIDGHIDPVLDKEVAEVCDKCGYKKILERRYLIPRKRRNLNE